MCYWKHQNKAKLETLWYNAFWKRDTANLQSQTSANKQGNRKPGKWLLLLTFSPLHQIWVFQIFPVARLWCEELKWLRKQLCHVGLQGATVEYKGKNRWTTRCHEAQWLDTQRDYSSKAKMLLPRAQSKTEALKSVGIANRLQLLFILETCINRNYAFVFIHCITIQPHWWNSEVFWSIFLHHDE